MAIDNSVIFQGFSPALAGGLLAVVVILLAAVWWFQVGRAGRWLKTLAVMMRLVAVVAILVVLMEPVLRSREAVPRQSFLFHLFDVSGSMNLDDYDGGARIDAVAHAAMKDSPARKRLDEAYLSAEYTFDEHVQSTDAEKLLAGTKATDLASALRQIHLQTAGLPVSGVVLYSDGNNTVGGRTEDVVNAAVETGVPVYTVGSGPAEPAPDLWIEKVIHSNEVAGNVETPVTVLAGARGMARKPVTILLTEDGRIVATREITPENDLQVLSVEFKVKPRGAGVTLYNASVTATATDTYSWNNDEDFFMNVVAKQRRVLYVEGTPRYEYRFLRAAFEDDERFEVTSAVYVTRDGEVYRQGIADSGKLRSGFPTDERELFAYDVVVIGNVSAARFTASQLSMLREFVRKRGGGLLFLGGDESFRRNGFGTTPLADVLPFDLESTNTGLVRTESHVVPTHLGIERNLFGEYSPASQKPAPWKDLPSLNGLYKLDGLKPGAQVLCAIDENRGESNSPVIAFQRFGKGTCLVNGVSATWPWKFQTPSSDTRYQSFWKEMILVLMEAQQGLLRVNVDPAVTTPGTKILFSGAALNPSFELDHNAEVRLELELPDKTTTNVSTQPTNDPGVTFLGNYTPAIAGVYRLKASATSNNQSVDTEALFIVKDESPELGAVDLNEPMLRELAESTGGAYVHLADYASLADHIQPGKEAVYREKEKALWDSPWILGAILVLLTGEWLLRRMGGLA